MGGIDVNLEQWPVVFAKFDGKQSIEDMKAYIDEMSAVYRRQEPFVAVTWLKRYASGPDQVSMFGRWMMETEQKARDYSLAACIVTQSHGFRFVLSALFLIRPLPVPYIVTGTFAEALFFARGEAWRRGLRLPPGGHPPWADAP